MSNLENSIVITVEEQEEQQARQHTFDTIAWHLLTQGRQCGGITKSTGTFQCLYRGPDGTRCAIGALIPDELWHEEDNTLPLGALIAGRNHTGTPINFKALGYTGNGSFLQRLQEIHDEYAVEDWKVALTEFAVYYTLDSSVVMNYPPA